MKILTILILGTTLMFGSVDINSANAEELATLKGIGAKKAERILKYRETKCFKDIQALKEIKGIGKKILKKNSGNISAGKCKI